MGQKAAQPGFKLGHLAPGPYIYHHVRSGTSAVPAWHSDGPGNVSCPCWPNAWWPLQMPRARLTLEN